MLMSSMSLVIINCPFHLCAEHPTSLQSVVPSMLERRPKLKQLLLQHGVLTHLLKPGEIHK